MIIAMLTANAVNNQIVIFSVNSSHKNVNSNATDSKISADSNVSGNFSL